MIKLYKHQSEALDATDGLNKVAYYHDMGLGKTFTGSEKMMELDAKVNLVICQKSKIDDWVEHFKTYYPIMPLDLTVKRQFDEFVLECIDYSPQNRQAVGIINYELAFRRPELSQLTDFTLMLDESSLIQNESAKRSKFILKKLKPLNVILLSGTPTGGKYEKLWSQLHLLGWGISKKLFWQTYVNVEYLDNLGFSIPVVKGYKNVERLKRKMDDYGCHFLKTSDVFDLPLQNFQKVRVSTTKEYRKFKKDCVIDAFGHEFVGDTTLTKMLYERQLCGSYDKDKLNAFRDLIESTCDRVIVFYNFNDELDVLMDIASDYTNHVSIVNGGVKDLKRYEDCDDSITFIQYQAGAMGLNLQKANKIIYFTPPLSSELYEQSKKRIHRIGQEKPCFYYQLVCKNSIEEKIYGTLSIRRDYTQALFEKGEKQ